MIAGREARRSGIGRLRHFLAIFLVLSSASMASAQADANAQTDSHAQTADQIAEGELWNAMERLGDDRFNVRQQAMETLWRAGETARPMLEKAAQSDDRETASRALAVLHRFAFGLYVDTPPETAQWINSYRFGDFMEKRAVLDRLRERGQVARLVQLVAAESDESLRLKLSRLIVADIQKYTSQLRLEGAEKEWDALLRLGASSDDGMRHYAAFLVLTNRSEDKLRQLRNDLTQSKSAATARQIVWIHRAKGDLVSAQAIARAHRQIAMEQELAYESRDWEAVERLIRHPGAGKINHATDIQSLGFEAASQRLQDEEERFVRTMTTISDMASSRKGSLFFAAEAMLINGYVEDGIALVTETSQLEGFRLLVRQGKYKRAFDLVGLSLDKKERDGWFATTIKESTKAGPDRDVKFDLLNHTCRAMNAVGMSAEMLERLEQIAVAAREDKSRHERLISLTELANETGHRDAARRFASDAILGGRSAQTLGVLFGNNATEAVACWRYLDVEAKSLEKVERFLRLEAILTPSTGQTFSADQLNDLSQRWKNAYPRDSPAKKASWFRALAEIQLIHGAEDKAVETLDEVAENSSEAAMRSAELKFAKQDYQAAEQAFSLVLKLKPNDTSALYLRGWVKQKLGQAAEGQAEIDRARLMPLAVVAEISQLAESLKRNGLADEAVGEFRRVLRLGEFKSWAVNNAAKQIGNTISGHDRGQAAQQWQRLLFSGFKRDSRFTAIEGYLQLSHLVHKTRARGLLDQGQPFEASREILAALAAIPNDISLAEDLVPLMDELGLKNEANLLFDQVYFANKKILGDFPQSPMHLNNLAWVSARCDRRLEDALPLARKANELRPQTASYLDTLGEVLFRMGRREEAIACAEKCVKLSPQSSFYREQLERFRDSNP
jgi:tetratricopeptide (TPR) repeat protein